MPHTGCGDHARLAFDPAGCSAVSNTAKKEIKCQLKGSQLYSLAQVYKVSTVPEKRLVPEND
jgi:Mor family transcriptional regulator